MSHVSFVGLGNMGLPMAINLVKAGHVVRGYDLSATAMATFAAHGHAAQTLADCITGAEVIVTMLPAGKHVEGVITSLLPLLGGAKPLLIDSSTIDVDTARAVSKLAAEAGLEMLDAPVSGGVGGATAGTLTFMVGGPETAFARGLPLLQAMGRTIVHTGGAGAGQAAKICNNMILGISMMAVSEAFVLADRLGLDRQKLFDVSSTASGQCWSLTNYCPAPGLVPSSPANRGWTPGFAATLMAKDLTLSQEAAAASGAATPLGAHAARLYQQMLADGEGDRDFSYAYPWLGDKNREDLA